MRYPNTSKLVEKNSACASFFNPLLSVWISDETLFLVFDILHERNIFYLSKISKGTAFLNRLPVASYPWTFRTQTIRTQA